MRVVLIILVLCCLAYWVNENYNCYCNCKARNENFCGDDCSCGDSSYSRRDERVYQGQMRGPRDRYD